MTVGELRATVQDYIGPNNGQRSLSAALIDELLFKGAAAVYREIVDWRSRKTYTASIVASTASYDMPTDIGRILSVARLGLDVDASDAWTQLRPVLIDDSHYDYEEIGPAYYLEVSSTPGLPKLTLLPTPDTAVTDGLKVRYQKKPARLSTFAVSAEYTEVDEALHLPLAQYAAWLFLSRQGSRQAKDSSPFLAYFNEEVQREKMRLQETWQDDFAPSIIAPFGGLVDY